MIISKLKPCCYNCKCPDIEVKTGNVYACVIDDQPEFTDATIYCAHARVCKNYIESTDE